MFAKQQERERLAEEKIKSNLINNASTNAWKPTWKREGGAPSWRDREASQASATSAAPGSSWRDREAGQASAPTKAPGSSWRDREAAQGGNRPPATGRNDTPTAFSSRTPSDSAARGPPRIGQGKWRERVAEKENQDK